MPWRRTCNGSNLFGRPSLLTQKGLTPKSGEPLSPGGEVHSAGSRHSSWTNPWWTCDGKGDTEGTWLEMMLLYCGKGSLPPHSPFQQCALHTAENQSALKRMPSNPACCRRVDPVHTGNWSARPLLSYQNGRGQTDLSRLYPMPQLQVQLWPIPSGQSRIGHDRGAKRARTSVEVTIHHEPNASQNRCLSGWPNARNWCTESPGQVERRECHHAMSALVARLRCWGWPRECCIPRRTWNRPRRKAFLKGHIFVAWTKWLTSDSRAKASCTLRSWKVNYNPKLPGDTFKHNP